MEEIKHHSRSQLRNVGRVRTWAEKVQIAKEQMNAKGMRLLGGGLHGLAFSLPNNKVLKITDSYSEYKAARILEGHKNDYLVDIYKAEYLDNHNTIYVILQERLRLLSEHDYRCLEYLDSVTTYDWSHSTYPTNIEEMEEKILRGTNGLERPINDSKTGRPVSNYIKNKALKFYRDAQGCHKEAQKKRSIHIMDMHKLNMGFKPNGNLGMFDIVKR